MGRLVSFPLDHGDVILVEVADDEEPDGAPVFRGIDGGGMVEQAEHSFQEAIARIRPAAQTLVTQLRSIADAPDEMLIRFGLDLHAKAGAFIAEAGADANFVIELSWHRS